MWLFTEIADGFDKMVHEDEVFLDDWGTEAAAKHLRGDGSIELGVAAGTYALFKFTTTVSKGFVDVLRIGDGVKKGGWGYGEDALRALVVAGPALRGLRMASGLVTTVDINASMGNCAWVAAARGARFSGRFFASIKDVARFAGITFEETGGVHLKELVAPLRLMGAEAKLVVPEGKAAFTTMEEVGKAAAQNRDGTVMFGINWMMNGKQVGHALIARWGLLGVRFIDRTGRVVSSLSELESIYPGIGSAYPILEGLYIGNTITTRIASTAPSLFNVLAVEVKPIIVNKGPIIGPPKPPAGIPPGVVPAKPGMSIKNMGRVTKTTTCSAPNSDMPIVCSSYYSYQVVAGDSLAKIAGYAYKDESRWKVIYEANKNVLGPNPHDPKALKAGMELFIPSL